MSSAPLGWQPPQCGPEQPGGSMVTTPMTRIKRTPTVFRLEARSHGAS
jgi:hypothetical protein